jgi:hypothetical protein
MENQAHRMMIQEQHPVSHRWAIFEDDGVSAWLYLTEPNLMRPVADCWVYNRIDAPPSAEIEKYRGGPPPACMGYAGPGAQYPRGETPQARLLWSDDGEGVAIVVDGVALGFILSGSKSGYSRHLLRTGPWGQPWDEQRYQALFRPVGVEPEPPGIG